MVLFSHILSPHSGPTQYILHVKERVQGLLGDKSFFTLSTETKHAGGSKMSHSIKSVVIFIPAVAQKAQREENVHISLTKCEAKLS